MTEQVPIGHCVHYGGFRYGRDEYHPYETYVIQYHRQLSIREIRRNLIDFVRYYRPRHMAEALGQSGLSLNLPLWIYPWQPFAASGKFRAWHDNPDAMDDIITQFCEAGILSHRIDQEFFWLERSYCSISSRGFDPERNRAPGAAAAHYSPITGLKLVRRDGETRFLLLDGNHRVSALSALGHACTPVDYCPGDTVREEECEHWPGVQRGLFNKTDALGIFRAYFDGNRRFRTASTPAPILGPDSWKDLYGI